MLIESNSPSSLEDVMQHARCITSAKASFCSFDGVGIQIE